MGARPPRSDRDTAARDAKSRDAGGAKREVQRPPAKIRPVKKRIGEGHGNLRRRESWFRKRTTGSE